MIKLSRMADYAVVLMTHLALTLEDGLQSAHDISSAVNLSEATVGKLLKQLQHAGLLQSERGLKGGYKLARQIENITIADIVTAVDGPIAITECTQESDLSDCNLEALCPTRVGWHRINDAVKQAFESVTLQEILSPTMFEKKQVNEA